MLSNYINKFVSSKLNMVELWLDTRVNMKNFIFQERKNIVLIFKLLQKYTEPTKIKFLGLNMKNVLTGNDTGTTYQT